MANTGFNNGEGDQFLLVKYQKVYLYSFIRGDIHCPKFSGAL
jgi:hypothetical protein